MALMGAVEVPAYSVSAPITQRLGRRPVICFCLISCGLLLLSLLLLEMYGIKEGRLWNLISVTWDQQIHVMNFAFKKV